MSDMDHGQSEGLFSKSVRAGKRTYFFDVRATRQNDYYLTITESKKKFMPGSGDKPFYEKHKIFLYKEDFEKFIEGLHEAVNAIQTDNVKVVEHPTHEYDNNDVVQQNDTEEKSLSGNTEGNNFTDIRFEDLK